MDLKCKEVLLKQAPESLKHFAAAAWINSRKNWDPELAKHLAKCSADIRDIVFDCDIKEKGQGVLYTYNSIAEIVKWEETRTNPPYRRTKLPYRPRWLSKNMKRHLITVKLQDEIEMDEYPHKKVCKRLFSD